MIILPKVQFESVRWGGNVSVPAQKPKAHFRNAKTDKEEKETNFPNPPNTFMKQTE